MAGKVEFVTSYAEKLGISAWLNLDHCRDEQMVRDAMDKGWDSVMLDMSQKSLAENIAAVNKKKTVAKTVFSVSPQGLEPWTH